MFFILVSSREGCPPGSSEELAGSGMSGCDNKFKFGSVRASDVICITSVKYYTHEVTLQMGIKCHNGDQFTFPQNVHFDGTNNMFEFESQV